MSKRSINTDPFADVDLDFLAADPERPLTTTDMRLEYLALELLRPDPAQPRRVLPPEVHQQFHAQQISAAQALRAFVHKGLTRATQQGRPARHVLDLLETTTEDAPDLTGHAAQLRDLVQLAVTLGDGGQVNPLTVIDVAVGTAPLYRIETGERRYWAALLRRDFIAGPDEAVTLLCRIIPAANASPFRQAYENTARADLNAMAMARQAALLLFAVHDRPAPEGPVDNDYYRQALDLDLKPAFAREQVDAVLAAMGGIKRAQFSRVKKLLHLSDQAMTFADERDYPMYVLQKLADFSHADQDWYIDLAAENDWSPQEMLKNLTTQATDRDQKMATAAVRVIRRDFRRETDARQVAAQLLEAEHGDTARAIGHLQSKINWFTEIRRFLEES